MKKRLEEMFYLFACGVNDLSHLVVLIIFEMINVLVTVDALCRLLLLFLSGSSQESTLWRTLPIVCRVPLLIIFFSIIYPVVIDF